MPEIVSGVLPLYEPSTYVRAPEGEEETEIEPVIGGIGDNVADMNSVSLSNSIDVCQSR